MHKLCTPHQIFLPLLSLRILNFGRKGILTVAFLFEILAMNKYWEQRFVNALFFTKMHLRFRYRNFFMIK